VATIDGIPAKEQAAYVRSRTNLFDAQVQSTSAVQMLTNWSIQYRDNNCDKPAHLTFTDASTVEVPFLKPNHVRNLYRELPHPSPTMYIGVRTYERIGVSEQVKSRILARYQQKGGIRVTDF